MNFLRQTYRGKYDWWRWLIILTIFFTPFLSDLLKKYCLKLLLPVPFKPEYKSLYIILNFSVYIILLIVFVLLFKLLHKRKFLSLITARKKIDWVRFWFSFGTWGMLMILMFLSTVLYEPNAFEWNFKPVPFVKYLLISLILMPFQILFHTVLMRGYLLQASIFMFKKPWIALIVTAGVYCFFMYMQNERMTNLVGNEVIIHYTSLAFLIVLIVILDDGLEIVLGMTFANNLIASVFVTDRSMGLDSVLVNDGEANAFIMVYVTAFLLCPFYFLFLKKMYKWDNWRQKLTTKQEKV